MDKFLAVSGTFRYHPGLSSELAHEDSDKFEDCSMYFRSRSDPSLFCARFNAVIIPFIEQIGASSSILLDNYMLITFSHFTVSSKLNPRTFFW